jgi:hypothetical protein
VSHGKGGGNTCRVTCTLRHARMSRYAELGVSPEDEFSLLCEEGSLGEVQMLYEAVASNGLLRGLRVACLARRLEVAKWVHAQVVDTLGAEVQVLCEWLLSGMCGRLARSPREPKFHRQFWLDYAEGTSRVIKWLLTLRSGWPASVPTFLRQAFETRERRWTWIAAVVACPKSK